MKSVKFVSSDPTEKEFANAVRKNVNQYFFEKHISNKGNTAMFVKAIAMLILYLTPFVLLFTIHWSTGVFFLLWGLMGIGAAGVGMSVMHDGAHGTISGKMNLNKMFASTMYMIGGNPFNWKVQHNILHHSYTNIYGMDQDIETKAVIRLCDHAPLKRFHRFQFVYAFFLYGLMTLSKLVTEFGQLKAFNREGITAEQHLNPRKEMVKLVISKCIYFGVLVGIPMVITTYLWWQILIGYCLMQMVAGMIMSTIFQMAHVVEGAQQPLPDENGVIHKDWMVHQLQTTSDFAPGNILLNWYVGGLNFQIEHHLFPNICHIHYRKIAPIVAQTAKEFGLNYNLKPTFPAAFKSHVKRLKELGRA